MAPKNDNQGTPKKTAHKRTVSSGNFDMSSSADSSVSSRHDETVIVQDMSMTKRSTPRSASVQHNQPDSDFESKQVPQPGSINLRDSPRHRNDHPQLEKRPSSTGRRIQPMVPTQNQPETAEISSGVTIPKNVSTNLPQTSYNEFYNNASSNNKTEVIDSLELNALRDTNNVLKSEVQRLSGLEVKVKELENSKNEV